MTTVNEPNPFVGLRPYGADDVRGLFGRDSDIEKIESLVIVNRSTLVFGQAGVGKSSIIGAVTRRLETEGFEVRFLRIDPANIAEGIPVGAQQPVAVVIDHAEEIFTRLVAKADRREWFCGWSREMEDSARLHILAVMRENFLAEMLQFSDLLPFRGMYRLERFDRFAARHILERGIALSGFQIEPAAADAVVSRLSAGGDTVESVHLQVIGRRLFEIARAESRDLTLVDIEREVGAHDPLQRYVDDAIKAAAIMSGVKESQLRQWLSIHLITGMGNRAFTTKPELLSARVSPVAVEGLVSSRILNAEQRHGVTYYELAHDLLIHAIQEARDEAARRKRAWWKP
jgi:GTPase SAR1 family protein